MESFDQGLWNWFQAHRSPWLDPLVLNARLLGTASVLAVVVGLAVLFLIWKRQPVSAGMAAAAFGLSWLLVGPVQTLIGRERPEVKYLSLENTDAPYSFPSAHTWLATATYLAVALALADVLPRTRRLAIGAAALLALAVGVSRLFVGLCYPSDGAAGWLSGFCLATLLRSVAKQNP